MELDNEKIDDAVLAILMLGTSGNKAWKGIDGSVLVRLHERGFISNPHDKSTTLIFSPEGLSRAKKLRDELFARS